MKQKITRNSECINNPKVYDVIVLGGGVTGCTAAIAAARGGARVLLVEKLPFLGGNMTGGLPWLGFHDFNTGEAVVNGIPMEIIHRLQAMDGATEFVRDPITGSAVGVNGSMLKLVLLKMLDESKVEIRLHSMLVDTEMNNNAIDGVYIQGKTECEYIRAKVFIDCTDNADACVLAGCRTVLGRLSDGKRQISSNVIIFGEIDFRTMLDYFTENPDQIRPFSMDDDTLKKLLEQMRTAPLFVIGGFEKIIGEAKAEGVDYKRRQLVGVAYPDNNELMLVASRVEDVDLSDPVSHTKGEIEGLEQTSGILELLRHYIPGCQKARIVSTGAQLGIRETRHVECDYILSAEDLLSARPFEDSIAKGAYHLDIHSPDHDGLESRRPPIYQIPYRSLLPVGVDNLLVAGRCIGATHEAMSSTRVAPVVGALGQSAGTAAAIAVSDGVALRDISLDKLRGSLNDGKAIF